MIVKMLILFNILGSERENHSVHSSETYNTLEHIHQCSVQKAQFFISLFIQFWSNCIRSIKIILKEGKHIESIFTSSICFDMFYKNQHTFILKNDSSRI